MEKITLNGKEYNLKEINFGTFRVLEKLGITIKVLEHYEDNLFNIINAFVAFNCDTDIKGADNIINSHIKNGGDFQDFVPMIEAMYKSDFIQRLLPAQKKAK